jgi:hypothetical protein
LRAAGLGPAWPLGLHGTALGSETEPNGSEAISLCPGKVCGPVVAGCLDWVARKAGEVSGREGLRG